MSIIIKPKSGKLSKYNFMNDFNKILKIYKTPIKTKKLLGYFSEKEELVPMIKTLRYYYRANETLHKYKEKPYILAIIKLVHVLMKNKVGGALVEYDNFGDGQLDEYRKRKNRLGQLFMLMNVGIVIFLFWMLFQQLVKDINSLENSLEMMNSTQDRIVDILIKSVDDSFKELDMKLSQSDILVSLDEEVSLPSFMEYSSQELEYEPLSIGDGKSIDNENPIDNIKGLSESMYNQFKHILALKSGMISAIYAGWAYNEKPGETTLEVTSSLGKQFIKQSTEIVSKVVKEKSDQMDELSVKYKKAISSRLTEEYKQEKTIELLSTFLGVHVATNTQKMVLDEINTIMTEELLFFMTNTNTRVQNRISTDIRIYLDRVKRYSRSIYNILWCIQRIIYISFILPIINMHKTKIVEIADRQVNGALLGDREILALEDKGRLKKKKSKKKKSKKKKSKKKGYTQKKK